MRSRILPTIVVCALSLAVASAVGGLTLNDPSGDDHGPGSYVYPLDAVFTTGSYDITSVVVDEVGSVVRFEIAIAGEIEDPWGSGAGFSIQSIDIYIDQDGVSGSGSTAALEGRNVEFSPVSAWEYVIWCAPPSLSIA